MGDYTLRVGDRTGFVFSLGKTRRLQWALKPQGLSLFLMTLGACGDGEKPYAPVNEKAAGALVSVDKGETEIGFARGKLRVTEKTESFKISKHPVTKKQYESCQKAGVCQKPKSDECSDPELAKASMKGDDDNAAVCVGRENAEAFCKWVGGRLPTLGEWMRAARGPKVQEYPWGAVPGNCSQHPKFERESPQSVHETSLASCASTQVAALVTRKHTKGASRSGLEDILLTPAELLQGSKDTQYNACVQGQPCLIYGTRPGAISSVESYYILGEQKDDRGGEADHRFSPMAYAFRCTLTK
jgi:hypothetical protein